MECPPLSLAVLLFVNVREKKPKKKKKTKKLSPFVIYIEANCRGSFINFIVVAVFINCSNL